MPFLNLNYGFVIYENNDDPRNPDVRTPDIKQNIDGVTVNFDHSQRDVINPNEIKDIATTARALLWDSTTELQFDRYISSNDNIRLTWTGTGTAPAFRTNRQIGGDATTTVAITRVTAYVARISVTAGTAWTLGSVQSNDLLRFEKDDDSFSSPFSEANRGKEYLVQTVGANYIDFVDNGAAVPDTNITLGADYAKALKVVSQGPVKAGDTIEVSGAGIHPSNHGKFEVIDVSDDYLEIVNGLGVEETFLFGTNSLVVYEYLIGFLHLRGSAPFKIRFGGQTEWVQIDRLGPNALFLGSICTHKIEAKNDGVDPVTFSVQYAMVSSSGT